MIADTNALSAFLAGDASVAPIFAEAAELCLPVIVLGEYRYGRNSGPREHPYRRTMCG